MRQETLIRYADLVDAIDEAIKECLVEEKDLSSRLRIYSRNFCKAVQSYEEDTDPEEKFLYGLNHQLREAFEVIEKSALGTSSEKDIKGLFDDFDLESNRLGNSQLQKNKRLRDLMVAIGKIDLGRFEDNYLVMRMSSS